MDDNILKILDNIHQSFKDIREYVLNTEHYIFYWIENDEIKQFIEDNPEDYEDEFEFTILNVGGGTATVRLDFHLYGYDTSITRCMFLNTFRQTVKSKWLQYHDKINELRISETEDRIASLKKQLDEEEKFLAELKNKSICDA